jgi:hypothetical protein
MTWNFKRTQISPVAMAAYMEAAREESRREQEQLECVCRSGLPILYVVKPSRKVIAAYCKKCKPRDYVRELREQLLDVSTELFPETPARPDRCRNRGCPYPSRILGGECWYCSILEFFEGRLSSSWKQFEMTERLDDDEDAIEEEREVRRRRTQRYTNVVQSSPYWKRDGYDPCRVSEWCARPRRSDGKPCEAFKLFGLNGCAYHATGVASEGTHN